MAVLETIDTELTASGELVATGGLAVPDEATLVRGEEGGMPVTNGVFPDSKELGYWIVDVQTPERGRRYRDEYRQHPDREECRPICRLRCGEWRASHAAKSA